MSGPEVGPRILKSSVGDSELGEGTGGLVAHDGLDMQVEGAGDDVAEGQGAVGERDIIILDGEADLLVEADVVRVQDFSSDEEVGRSAGGGGE